MAEKQNNSISRRYNLIHNNNNDNDSSSIDHQTRTNSNHEQPIAMPIEYLPIAATIPKKRRRSSITNEQSLATHLCSSNQDFIYERNITMATTIETRKRSAQDDLVAFTAHQFLQNHEHYAPKRARYENSNSFESENQPPLLNSRRRSLFFHQEQEDNHLPSTWNHQQTSNDISLLFNDIPSSLSHSTIPTYYRTNSEPDNGHHLSNEYLPLLTEHHHSSIFNNNSLITTNQKSTMPKSSKTSMRFFSPQLNGSSPLRTTNLLFDNKQHTIIRTGNISPAHSDSSSESTSTCSSDEQLHHHHYHHFYQPQPWRSYRERENYEQLLDLAEKLSDPNRFNQVDVQQFFSYRYKTPPVTSTLSSKQTACVICMSHFKNGQHIRVLPCQHEYHSKCIARWFAMNSSCPICRRDNFLSSC